MSRILVTGAASGIGRATVAILRGDGVDVLELDVVTSAGTIHCDLGDAMDVRRAAETIDGPLDGIAHVAGLPGTHPPQRVFAVNFLGARALTEHLATKLRAGASIVYVSSLAAQRCSWSDADLAALAARGWDDALATVAASGCNGSDAYDLSKRMTAFELPHVTARFAPAHVRANLVSPGPVDTPILADFRATMGADRLDGAERLTGRHARPEEIAHAIVFLLRPSSSWINGVDLRADGGLHALRAAKAT